MNNYYREFPQPFLDLLAEHILWHSTPEQQQTFKGGNFLEQSIGGNKQELLTYNAMLVNKQWRDTFLRRIGKCTSIELRPQGFKNLFLAKKEEESKCAVYLKEKLLFHLIELNYLKTKCFSTTCRMAFPFPKKIVKEFSSNWLESFVRIFMPNIKQFKMPETMANSKFFDEFTVKFEGSELEYIYDEAFPLLLMLKRKSYKFVVHLYGYNSNELLTELMSKKLKSSALEKFTIEYDLPNLTWNYINWSEFIASTLAMCPNLKEIILHLKLDFSKGPNVEESIQRLLRFLSDEGAVEILSMALPSIEIENSAERPTFHVEIAFTIYLSMAVYKAIEHMFRLPFGSKIYKVAAVYRQFALFNFPFEGVAFNRTKMGERGFSRIAKTTDRHGNVHHFKFTLTKKKY